MNELHLFAGAGGGILGGMLLGHTTVCAVEIDPYCRKVLLQRQRDGILPRFPIWDDIRTFDGTPWLGKVDIVTGGFPCQDISAAGKGAGITGERSGLWAEMFRIICEIRPKYVFVENSPILTSRGLGRVLGDLAKMGFDARWGVLGARHVGAPHKRDRIWIFAYSRCERGEKGTVQSVRPKIEVAEREDVDNVCTCVSNANSKRVEGARAELKAKGINKQIRGDWWAVEPDVGRVANGVANRVDRLKAIGNGQVPAVAALAFKTLMEHLK